MSVVFNAATATAMRSAMTIFLKKPQSILSRPKATCVRSNACSENSVSLSCSNLLIGPCTSCGKKAVKSAALNGFLSASALPL